MELMACAAEGRRKQRATLATGVRLAMQKTSCVQHHIAKSSLLVSKRGLNHDAAEEDPKCRNRQKGK
jgi:hypothetical protein